MAVSIDTQKRAQAARRALDHCYICSDPIPKRGTPGRSLKVIGDHVLPESMLNLASAEEGANWPVVLDVHAECERDHKQKRDHLAMIMQIMGSVGPMQWTPDELGKFRNQCKFEIATVNGQPVPVIDGAGDILLAAILWVRGFHAALYGEVLPNEVGFITHCPAPACEHGDRPIEELLALGAVIEHAILSTLRRMIPKNRTDRIILRSKRIEYHCTWVRVLDPSTHPWWCYWTLDLPGSPAWSQATRGYDSPWHGAYSLPYKPESATAATARIEGDRLVFHDEGV